ncbi:MAG TPA: lysylphosphatidylglycerol synthase domain-containing protein [Thermoanaerobaculia bacterium]|nr:lysylphosphatidylglycerol synthase domain-containing protein [Thermoanaerobaculia bacterium]
MNRWWRTGRRLLLALIILLLTLYLLRHRHDVVESLSHLTWRTLLLLCGLELVNSLLHAHRLYLVAREQGPPMDMIGAIRVFIVGRFLNTFIPQGGTVYRGVRLKSLFALGYTQYLRAMAGFTWLSLVVTLALSVAVLSIAPPAPSNVDPFPAVAWLLALLLATPVAAAVIVRFAGWLIPLGYFTRRAEELLDGLRVTLARPRLLAPFLVSSVVSFVLWVAFFSVALHSFGLAVHFGPVAVLVVLVRIGSLVTVTPGNVGVLEVASGALVDWLGFSAADGVLVVALARAVAMVVVVALSATLSGRELLESLQTGLHGQGRAK